MRADFKIKGFLQVGIGKDCLLNIMCEDKGKVMVTKKELLQILSDTESYNIERTELTGNMDKFCQTILESCQVCRLMINSYYPKCNICTLNCTLEELVLLNFIKEKPNATQKEIAVHIRKSERTVKTMTVKLAEQGIIERKNGRRNGYWVIKNSKTNN